MSRQRTSILNALQDLREEKFREFCDKLTYRDAKPRIRVYEVERKTRDEIKELLVSRCRPRGAVNRAIKTLKGIGCNDEAAILAKEAGLTKRKEPSLKTPPPKCSSNARDTAGSSTSTDIYPVTSSSIKNRVALLITNINFYNMSVRRGAEKDEEYMGELLPSLGYEVVKHRDLTAKEMEGALVEFSKHPNLKETDSVFVVISSHGQYGAVFGVGSCALNVDDIYNKLNAENCPALVDKPKIVIIQACRGYQKGSVRMSNNVEADAAPLGDTREDVSQFTHTETDFISLLASTPHTCSYRTTSEGSFLIKYTVDVFKTNVLKDHIEDLFRKVIKQFKEGKELPDHLKQMPTKDRCTLAQHFFLFPGRLKQLYPVVGQRDQSPGPSDTSFSTRCSSGTTLRDVGCKNKAEERAAEADADRSQPAPRRDRSRSPLRAKPSLSRDDSSPTPRNDPKELLSSVRPDFVDNVSEAVLDQLLDRLLQKKLLNKGEMESAKQKGRSEKARYVVDTVLGKGPKAASFLIKEYCELDPCSELCDRLKL